jgi:hypothetical protein
MEPSGCSTAVAVITTATPLSWGTEVVGVPVGPVLDPPGRVVVPDPGIGSPHATTTRTRASKIDGRFMGLGRRGREFGSGASDAFGWRPFGSFESDAAVFGMVVEGGVLLVDDDVVVVPAEGDEIVRVGWPTLAPGGDVVDLQPVSAVTSVCCAPVGISVDDGSA